ncbi:MAG: YfhO family protein [Acutalibacteraceae bacterium]
MSFYVYSLDMDKFKEGYEKLSGSGELKITSYNDTEIFGDITVNDGEMVYTSIPYDTNWEVYVDGVKVKADDIVKISDSLMGFYAEPGEHEIYFRYYSYGLRNGAIISIITIIIATLLIIMKRRKVLFYKKNKQDKWLLLNENAAAFDVSSAANPNDTSISGRADPPTEAIKPDLPEDNSTADKTPDEEISSPQKGSDNAEKEKIKNDNNGEA